MKSKLLILSVLVIISACQNRELDGEASTVETDDFNYVADRFADLRILRFQVDGFDQLSLEQKKMLYYLSEAALSGRDIMWDQNYKYNLTIRKTLEAIVSSYEGDPESESFENFMVYAKRVWFSNGIHHHYSNNKILPEFSEEYFSTLVSESDQDQLPMNAGESLEGFIARLSPILFDPTIAAKKVNLADGADLVETSAINFYEGVTQQEVEAFYNEMTDPSDDTPISYGLNSKVVKENGEVTERVWKVGGMYGAAIGQVVSWLEKASDVAENESQKRALDLLIEYYRTGDLNTFDEYNIAWVQDTTSVIDVISGFIEVYNDPLGRKGSFESVVSIKDFEASERIAALGTQAQWFEDNSPILPEHKKDNVKGISAKVITVVQESGDSSPSTPIGINLPNANWIRQQYGSKSVSLGNIVYAYEKAQSESSIDEFYIDPEMNAHIKEFGALGSILHTDMHEVIGHASGQLNPGVGQPHETLKSYASALEEGRADLVALYYTLDPKLVEIGVMPSIEVGKAEYDRYITNGLMVQLARLQPGEDVEEAHMRNRQMIAAWAYEKGMPENVIERQTSTDGRTYFVINDYEKLRSLFGELLREVQRIKSEGDFEAGRDLIETYGVKVDPELHQEVLDRYAKLSSAPYSGFIQPKLVAVMEGEEIVDVQVEYPEDFVEQMLYYGEEYAFLPVVNE